MQSGQHNEHDWDELCAHADEILRKAGSNQSTHQAGVFFGIDGRVAAFRAACQMHPELDATPPGVRKSQTAKPTITASDPVEESPIVAACRALAKESNGGSLLIAAAERVAAEHAKEHARK